jgi:hypothetical protein
MQSLTRKEYDHRTREGLAMPESFMLVEANGVHTYVAMTSGAAAAVENPRMKDSKVRVAVANLADLVEFYHVGVTDRPVDTPFSDFMQGPHELKLENADVFEEYQGITAARREVVAHASDEGLGVCRLGSDGKRVCARAP